MYTILKSFKQEKNTVLEKLTLLYESIQNLQYEGKVSFQKDIKDIEEIVRGLKKILFAHMSLDEGVIFPFARRHIPRLDPMISFLNAERNEFRNQLETFEFLVGKLTEEESALEHEKIFGQLREKGVYVVCIMRNHIQAESEGVYKVLDQELHVREKAELYKFINKNIRGYSAKGEHITMNFKRQSVIL